MIETQNIDAIQGLLIFITIITQVYEKVLVNIFSDTIFSHIHKIIKIGQFAKIGISFLQGYTLHIEMNQKDFKANQMLKILLSTYIQQEIPFITTYIVLAASDYKQQFCTLNSLNTLEFLQFPIMFGKGNSCGNIIHYVASVSFMQLSIIINYCLIKLFSSISNTSQNYFIQILKQIYSTNSIKTTYISNFVIWYIIQIIAVVKMQMNERGQDLSSYLNVTLDASSIYAGCICSYVFHGIYPMKDFQQRKLGNIIYKYIPKKFFGTVCLYSVVFMLQIINIKLSNQQNHFVISYFVLRILVYFAISIALGLILCDVKYLKVFFAKQLSQYGYKCLLVSEVVVFVVNTSIGDIKIGPENIIVVLLVATGILVLIIKMLVFADYLFKDINSLLDCK
ncbi:Hypothetical_protein [Hexamita inflata]|uniref:Hypothetical_protein n=1 Tax=Hexamita inflata TaxID=28002 RepID=A0ABP1KH52_9EUKA